MSKIMKFTGAFENLKKLGFEFNKLYARNYKVYWLDVGSDSFKVWVAHGGYIEFNDYYGNTTNFFGALKSINWDDVEPEPDIFTQEPIKRVFIRMKHGDSSKGYLLADTYKDIDIQNLTYEKLGDKIGNTLKERINIFKTEEYKESYKEINDAFDTEKVISEEYAKELLKILEEFQNC